MDLFVEVPFASIRKVARGFLKAGLKDSLKEYHERKMMAFRAQRDCFKRLMKIHTTMMCAAMTATPDSFIGTVNGKAMMKVKNSSMVNF